jgi:hypothetical protein
LLHCSVSLLRGLHSKCQMSEIETASEYQTTSQVLCIRQELERVTKKFSNTSEF